jgi:thioredoxin reductase (NADPH)
VIEIVKDRPLEIRGEDRVKNLMLKNKEITTDGVFVLKDSVAPNQLVPGLEMNNGHIKVDIDMKTNISGCFAAGDCVGGPFQYIKAAGEGNIAAHSAIAYLAKLMKNNN